MYAIWKYTLKQSCYDNNLFIWVDLLQEEIDCVDNVSPPIGISPIVKGSDMSLGDDDEEEEESVSEWELERMKEKVQ